MIELFKMVKGDKRSFFNRIEPRYIAEDSRLGQLIMT